MVCEKLSDKSCNGYECADCEMSYAEEGKQNKLNFGCGDLIKKGWDNCDIQEDKGVISFDFNDPEYPLTLNYYDFVLMKQVLEHMDKPKQVLETLWKHCRKDALICIEVPYYNNKGAYSEMEHIHYFNEICFENYAKRYARLDNKEKFEINYLVLIPTRIGKFIPKLLREKLSLFIGGLIGKLYVELKVLK